LTRIPPSVRRTLIVVLALNALVTLIKLVVGARTHAVTVLGAALESGLDLMNNVIAINFQYRYTRRDSNIPQDSFKKHLVGLNASARF